MDTQTIFKNKSMRLIIDDERMFYLKDSVLDEVGYKDLASKKVK